MGSRRTLSAHTRRKNGTDCVDGEKERADGLILRQNLQSGGIEKYCCSFSRKRKQTHNPASLPSLPHVPFDQTSCIRCQCFGGSVTHRGRRKEGRRERDTHPDDDNYFHASRLFLSSPPLLLCCVYHALRNNSSHFCLFASPPPPHVRLLALASAPNQKRQRGLLFEQMGIDRQLQMQS